MNHRPLPVPLLLSVGALMTAAVVAAVLISGLLPLDFAASDHHASSEIDVRVQARQTDSGRVEVRAQSSLGGGEWTTHTPDARFLPISPESGQWYSSNPFAISAPAPAPDISDQAAYTQAFVAAAIARYDRDGREATLAYYNSPGAADGQWYIFIIDDQDEQDPLIAHANPDLVGVPAEDVIGPDGYPAGLMVLGAATDDGAWVDYQFTNLATGQAEIKHSWVVRHDGLVFGSGWYEDAPSKVHAPGAFTQSYVARALEMYRVLGREATLAYYSTPDSADGQWYMFIHQTDGTRVAHAHRANRPGWLGSNVGVTGLDVTGYLYGADMLAIETSGWVSYVFPNPDDENQYRRKHSWMVTHDGLQFGSGWYENNYDLAAENPAGYARALVQQAVDLFDAEGRQAALDYYNSPESADGPWYVFILEDRDDGIYTIAHAARPELVGTTRERIDANGFNYGEAFAAVTEEAGEWVSYLFTHPEPREDAPKHSWVVRRGNLLFGAGWYEGIE